MFIRLALASIKPNEAADFPACISNVERPTVTQIKTQIIPLPVFGQNEAETNEFSEILDSLISDVLKIPYVMENHIILSGDQGTML